MVDPAGDKLGTIDAIYLDAIYLDDETGQPEACLIAIPTMTCSTSWTRSPSGCCTASVHGDAPP
jgi:hypothetical protein